MPVGRELIDAPVRQDNASSTTATMQESVKIKAVPHQRPSPGERTQDRLSAQDQSGGDILVRAGLGAHPRRMGYPGTTLRIDRLRHHGKTGWH